jgi:hypothetical protein
MILYQGNVGIGIDDPIAPLDLVSTGVAKFTRTTAQTETMDDGMEILRSSSGNMADGFGPALRYTITDAALGVANRKLIGQLGFIRDGAHLDNEGAFVVLAGTDGSQEFLRIDNEGNVGIGTSSPKHTLHVIGDANFTKTIFYGGNLTGYGADYAEMFEKLDASETIGPGDVVAVVNGKITKTSTDASLYMIVTDSAALIGNSGNGEIPVAFVGQVNTKVSGNVREGDYILASGSGAGYAKSKMDTTFDEFKSKVVGIALESKDSKGIERINVAVGVK